MTVRGENRAYRRREKTREATKAVDLMRARDASPVDAGQQRPDQAIAERGVSQRPCRL
jgi:hypothetical protein